MPRTAGDRLHSELLALWEVITAALGIARFEPRDGYVLLSYPAFAVPALNGVWASGESVTAVRELEGALAEIEETGVAPGLTVRAGDAPALEEEGQRLGLTECEQTPGMVATRASLRPPHVATLEIIAATRPDELARALDLMAAGFGIPGEWAQELYHPVVCETLQSSVYLGIADGRPVTTAYACPSTSSVGVFSVATAANERGHGYGAAVTARAAADAFAAGAEFVWLQASGMGTGVYRRVGFEPASMYRLWFRPGAGDQR